MEYTTTDRDSFLKFSLKRKDFRQKYLIVHDRELRIHGAMGNMKSSSPIILIRICKCFVTVMKGYFTPCLMG